MTTHELRLGSFLRWMVRMGKSCQNWPNIILRGTWNPVGISRYAIWVINRGVCFCTLKIIFSVIISGPKVSKSILKRHQNCWKGTKIVAFILGAPLTMFLASTPGRPFVNIDGSTKPGWNIWNNPQTIFSPKKNVKAMSPSHHTILTQTQKKASASNCYPTAFSLS